MRLGLTQLSAGLICGLLGISGAAAQSAPEIGTYIEPVRDKCDTANYFPLTEIQCNNEGWVNLRFTVKADGSVTNIETLTSVGGVGFPRVATRWLNGCTYKPGVRNGMPVDAENVVQRFYYRFDDSPSGATKPLANRLRSVTDLTLAGRLDEADANLDAAEKNSRFLYEYVHIILRRAGVQAARGRPDIAVRYLWQITDSKDYLYKNEYYQYQRMMLSLELRLGLLQNALSTVKNMDNFGKLDGDDRLMAALERLKALAASADPLVVSGRVPAECTPVICETEQPSWEYQPVRRTISLANIEGRLDEVSGRCDLKTFTVKAEAGITWTIPAGWGTCRLTITGTPGTVFNIIDENSPPPANPP